MGGGPLMRTTAYEYLNRNYQMAGMSSIEACTKRRWFARRNFHMQYYEDSHQLNKHLNYWRTSIDDYWQEISKDMPLNLRFVAFLSRLFPAFRKKVEQSAYNLMKNLVENHRNGTAFWYQNRNDQRISAFYKDYGTYEAIPEWDDEDFDVEPDPAWRRLDHGYDETKSLLALSDLQAAAVYRGGECLADEWNSDMFTSLDWQCASGHEFQARPNTILKAGHWCPECMAPPWDFDKQAEDNPFFAQVWYADHDTHEEKFFAEECFRDILDADSEWAQREQP
jgi:hypothetical protein